MWYYCSSSMAEPKVERRSKLRVAARLPVSVCSGTARVKSDGVTRDLSMTGVFL